MSDFDRDFEQHPDPKQAQEERSADGRSSGKQRAKPTHSVSFATIIGKDQNGRDVLGPARQIGSIWPRQGKEGDGIQRFDHIPRELDSRGGGVLFVRKLDDKRDKQSDKDAQKDMGYER